MNRGTLRAEVAFLTNFTEGTAADQDFTATRLNKAIQYAYRNEVRQAKLEGLNRWFKKTAKVTWPVSTAQITLAPSISRKNIIAFWDITNDTTGTMLTVSDNPYAGADFYWSENETLSWSDSTGPSSAITLRIEFLADAEFLAGDSDEPALIPPDYHDLLTWSAAIYLRAVGDEAPPAYWVQEQSVMRHDLWKFMSKGRPFSDVPTVGDTLVKVSGFSEAAVVGPGGGLTPP